MGYWQENGSLLGKRILVLTKPPKPATKRYAVYGKVADISKDEKILSLVHFKNPEITYEIKITSKTIISTSVDGETKKVNFDSIAVGDKLVTVGIKEDENETLTAKLIYLVSEKTKETTPTPTKSIKTTPTPGE